jgi:branched-chain amino acid transport system permease protein
MQFVINGIVAGAAYVLFGLSFWVIFRVCRFFHFAHGAVYAAAAYFGFLFSTHLGLPLPASIVAAVTASGLLGMAIDVAVYRPLRRRHASSVVLLLASLGTYIVLQNAISMGFGDATRSLRPRVAAHALDLLGAKITPIQVLLICVATAAVLGMSGLARRTALGRCLRAVANDSELARISGIRTQRVIMWTFALGSSLAGVASILVVLDVDMTPTMGIRALMMGVVVVVIGGVRNIVGVAFAGLLLGMAQHLGVWRIGSQWQDTMAFVILLAFLVLRPYGFFGQTMGKAGT